MGNLAFDAAKHRRTTVFHFQTLLSWPALSVMGSVSWGLPAFTFPSAPRSLPALPFPTWRTQLSLVITWADFLAPAGKGEGVGQTKGK